MTHKSPFTCKKTQNHPGNPPMVHEDWRHKAVPARRTHPAGESMPGAMFVPVYSQNSVGKMEQQEILHGLPATETLILGIRIIKTQINLF